MSRRPVKQAELIGRRFGHLTVVRQVTRGIHPRFELVCDCGGSVVTAYSHITQNMEPAPAGRSCGCLTMALQTWNRARRDGMCARWRESVDAFAADVGPRPVAMRLRRRDPSAPWSCGGASCPECGPAQTAPNFEWWHHRAPVDDEHVRRQLLVALREQNGVKRQIYFKRVRAGMDPYEAATRRPDVAYSRRAVASANPRRGQRQARE